MLGWNMIITLRNRLLLLHPLIIGLSWTPPYGISPFRHNACGSVQPLFQSFTYVISLFPMYFHYCNLTILSPSVHQLPPYHVHSQQPFRSPHTRSSTCKMLLCTWVCTVFTAAPKFWISILQFIVVITRVLLLLWVCCFCFMHRHTHYKWCAYILALPFCYYGFVVAITYCYYSTHHISDMAQKLEQKYARCIYFSFST